MNFAVSCSQKKYFSFKLNRYSSHHNHLSNNPFMHYLDISKILNHIVGVMVCMLTSSVVDRGFEPRSGQTNDYKIGICCFSAKHTGWLGIRIICPSGETCLPADCCLSELAL